MYRRSSAKPFLKLGDATMHAMMKLPAKARAKATTKLRITGALVVSIELALAMLDLMMVGVRAGGSAHFSSAR
jgi:hypothetical protein